MERIYLSIGSNLGDRMENLRRAVSALRTLGTLSGLSAAYESEPVGYTDQPLFLNAVVAMETESEGDSEAPLRLLRALLAIERTLGRRREEMTIAKGPRIIDLDLLLFGERTLHTVELTLPHPAMHERRFVLEPLAELAPSLCPPGFSLSVAELMAKLPADGPRVLRYAGLE